jgi:hypothetical protein
MSSLWNGTSGVVVLDIFFHKFNDIPWIPFETVHLKNLLRGFTFYDRFANHLTISHECWSLHHRIKSLFHNYRFHINLR